MKIGLITGITGQDGSYLAELLLEKNYIVYGVIRRASDINTHRIHHLYSNKNLILRYGDMTDSPNLLHILYEIKENNYDIGDDEQKKLRDILFSEVEVKLLNLELFTYFLNLAYLIIFYINEMKFD